MKILELTNYSSGGCGVFGRVLAESLELSNRGHKVRIFSSNLIKGKGNEFTKAYTENIRNLRINRFKGWKIGGESFIYWLSKEAFLEALKFKPDVIIAHSYRHLHTLSALRLSKKIGCKVLLVTHAPFRREKSRDLIGNLVVFLYDQLIGKKTLKSFDKVISITKWEHPFLLSLGLTSQKINYIPNGIADNFFTKNKKSLGKGIIYTGRISEIKSLETLILAVSIIRKNLRAKLFGPADKKYKRKLEELITANKLNSQIKIIDKKFGSNEQIKVLDDSFIYILPSISEGLPQSLIEAMARGKIVISSDNRGSTELIRNRKNGFIFQAGNFEDLARKISEVYELSSSQIKEITQEAKKTSLNYSIKNTVSEIEKTISQLR